MQLRLYEYPPSANCLKVRILLAHLGLSYERVETNIFGGDTLTNAYRKKNPSCTTPLLEVDGEYLPESNAILWFLAEGTPYLPETPFARASIVRWLIFEQVEVSGIATARFRVQIGAWAPEDERTLRERRAGERAVARLDQFLGDRRFLVDDAYTIADIANYSYVHLAPEAEIELELYPSVMRWLERVESQPGFVDDLAALPAHVDRSASIYA